MMTFSCPWLGVFMFWLAIDVGWVFHYHKSYTRTRLLALGYYFGWVIVRQKSAKIFTHGYGLGNIEQLVFKGFLSTNVKCRNRMSIFCVWPKQLVIALSLQLGAVSHVMLNHSINKFRGRDYFEILSVHVLRLESKTVNILNLSWDIRGVPIPQLIPSQKKKFN